MNKQKFTCTPVISTEQVDREIFKLCGEIGVCQHDGPIFKWNTKHNGLDIVANLCEICGKSWGEPRNT
jgi:hypothetical protein